MTVEPSGRPGDPETAAASRRIARMRAAAQQYDLFITAALSAVAGATILSGVAGPIGVASAAALVLALPGYAVMRALFLGGVRDGAERAALTVGISLCVTILGGFLLNALPDGLSATAWASWLTAVALIGCAVAALRSLGLRLSRLMSTEADRERTPSPAAAAPDPSGAEPSVPERAADVDPAAQSLRRIPRSQVVMLVAAVALVAGSLLVARLGVAVQPFPGFTQLWLVPQSDSSLQVGVTNHEGVATTYRLVVAIDGQVARQWASLPLGDAETWQQPYTLAASASAQVVDASLYRVGDTSPYRETHVTVQPGASVSPTGAVFTP